MILLDGFDNLRRNLRRQLSAFWDTSNITEIEQVITLALDKLERLLSCNSVHNKRVYENGQIVFNPLNSVQYSCFLYLLSNILYKANIQGGQIKFII